MNPFTLMRRFTEDLDRAFGTVPGTGETLSWSPTVEVKEVNGKFLVSAELPGLKKGDIKVQVTEDALILEGERKQEKEEKRDGYYHSERSYGHFYRSIPLPEGAQADKVSAEFVNGILQVSMPVAKTEKKPLQVPIQGEVKTKSAA